MSAARCHAVLPAAGIGARMGGDLPKQYQVLAGATLLEHSLGALLACPDIITVAVALHPDDCWAKSLDLLGDPRVRRVIGGAQRSDSVLAGLAALAGAAGPGDWVLVHDAARPCVQPADIARLIATVRSSGSGGLLAEPIVDTVKEAREDGTVVGTLDRSRLWRAQTPQMFQLGALRDALLAASSKGVAVTDEASAMEAAGHPVQLVPGSAGNLKVTVPADLDLAAWYLGRSAACEGDATCE
jgi:2-C-methyl-D-erythritol 4-phosphate cytidylyltransferase